MTIVLQLHTYILQQSEPTQATDPILEDMVPLHALPTCSRYHAAACYSFGHPHSMAALLPTARVHHLPQPRGQVQTPDLHRAAGALEGGCQHVDEAILVGRHRLNLQGATCEPGLC